MIVTVTLNPAVDKTATLACLHVDAVNRLRSVCSVAGGKGINVAKVLRQFHLSVAAMGFLGGRSGRMIEESMEELGVDVRFTTITGETRTNLNLLADDGTVTEILDPGPEVTGKEINQFERNFLGSLEECEMVVFSGSIPKGVPEDIYARLLESCARMGVPAILDTSGEPLKKALEGSAKPFLIKPNQAELETLCGRKLKKREEVVEEAQKLVDSGTGVVVVSMGADGLLYVDREHTLFEPAKSVAVQNTVGCGDTAVASLCMSILGGDTAQVAARKAAALAAANAVTAQSAVVDMDTYLKLL